MTESDINIVPAQTTALTVHSEQYGRILKRSRLCTVCTHHDHAEINLLRARDHLSLDRISAIKILRIDDLEIHFKNHFQISESNRKIIELRELGSTEANALVSKIMEGEVDLFSGAQGVLDTQAKRYNIIKNRIDDLSDNIETNTLDEFGTQEFVALNKLATKLETSILNTYQIVDKKLFPMRRDELANAILTYKLNVLSKMLDQIQVVLIEFERRGGFDEMINELRSALAERFNQIEDEILKSGGIINTQNQAPPVDPTPTPVTPVDPTHTPVTPVDPEAYPSSAGAVIVEEEPKE